MDDAIPISIDPEIHGGTPCFVGTRVPVKSLFAAMDRGRSIDDFLEQFPAVTPEQVKAVLQRAGELVEQQALSPSAA